MSLHTSGPWIVNPNGELIDGRFCTSINEIKQGAIGGYILEVAAPVDSPEEQAQALADIQLCAAAPELLQQLKRVIAAAGHHLQPEILSAARTAITKATRRPL